jgi:23S rRNA (uracil1939-C5)-methyltransferase
MKRTRHIEVEAPISGLAFGGKGIARLDGLAVFVDRVVPGDRARIRITRRRKNYAEARLVEVLEPSADRVPAPCRYSGICGGCSWQFLNYASQIAYKRQHVAESLAHIGGITGPPVHPTLPSAAVFGYRNKMEFTCSDRRWLLPAEMAAGVTEGGFALGLHAPGAFYKVIDIQECLLHPDPGNRILALIREGMQSSGRPAYGLRTHTGFWRFAMLRNSAASGRWMVNLVTATEDREALRPLAERLCAGFPEISAIVNNVSSRKAGIAVGESESTVAGDSCLRDRIGAYAFEISANSFFQTNTRAAARLYDTVKDYARLSGVETVVDLYSGTGTIPIWLSDRCREVIGIEIVPGAVADARRNCGLNGITNCRFLPGDIQHVLPEVGSRPEVMIVDPPRVGMAPEVVRQVLDMGPERIVYVSCNPATLARDLALLSAGYAVREIQPVDMFPHTFHIECVARLEKLRDARLPIEGLSG